MKKEIKFNLTSFRHCCYRCRITAIRDVKFHTFYHKQKMPILIFDFFGNSSLALSLFFLFSISFPIHSLIWFQCHISFYIPSLLTLKIYHSVIFFPSLWAFRLCKFFENKSSFGDSLDCWLWFIGNSECFGMDFDIFKDVKARIAF